MRRLASPSAAGRAAVVFEVTAFALAATAFAAPAAGQQPVEPGDPLPGITPAEFEEF